MLSPYAPVRILTFAHSLQGGGVERAMLRMIRGWVEIGQHVTLVLSSARGPLAAEIPDGVQLIELGTTHLGMIRALPQAVKSAAPDIVFCPGNHYSSAVAWPQMRTS